MIFDMQIIFLLNSITYISISLLLYYIYYQWCKKKNTCNIGKIVAVNSIFYLGIGIMNFIWFKEIIAATDIDKIMMHALLASVQAILLLLMIYKITQKRGLFFPEPLN